MTGEVTGLLECVMEGETSELRWLYKLGGKPTGPANALNGCQFMTPCRQAGQDCESRTMTGEVTGLLECYDMGSGKEDLRWVHKIQDCPRDEDICAGLVSCWEGCSCPSCPAKPPAKPETPPQTLWQRFLGWLYWESKQLQTGAPLEQTPDQPSSVCTHFTD